MSARDRIGTGSRGIVYLIHFARPYRVPTTTGGTKVVSHYLGWTVNSGSLRRRLAHHRAGTGARLMAAVSAAGIEWKVVALFRDADRHFERWLHDRCNTPSFCPTCQHTRRHIRRLAARLTHPTGAQEGATP